MQDVLRARTIDLEDMLAKCMEMEADTGRQASILYVCDMTGLKYDTRLLSLMRGALRSLTQFMAEHCKNITKRLLNVVPPCIDSLDVEVIKYFVLGK